MRPRLAIISMLAVGTLLMGAGTGLAVSGISSDNGDAGDEQYTTTTTTTSTPTGAVDVEGAVGGVEGAVGGVEGANEKGSPSVAQQTQQLEATGDGSLPLTGLAAIPVIAVGVGLMAGGLALRRRSS